MSLNFNEMNVSDSKLNKKASKKVNSQIPLDALGFKAKVFYDSAYEYVPRKKYNKYSQFEKQKRQLNFRLKLSCIIDPSHATHYEIGDMKFNKRAQWKKINYIIFRTKQELSCCICLDKKFIASQMTFCGHVFCWHCLLMHYLKSLKATSCPVCNQIYQIEQLKTCNTIFLPPISQGQIISFRLKTRIPHEKITFDPQTLQQQTNFSHIIRMKNINSLEKFNIQHGEILDQMKKNQDPQIQKYLIKILQKSQKKIDQLKQIIDEEKNQHLKPHKHEVFVDGVLSRVLCPQDLSSQKLMTFYQQQEGRYNYLHPICEKYLRKNFHSQYLPLRIEEEVLLKQQTQYSNQNFKKFKYLNHLPENQEFDFVFIRMNKLIDCKLLQQFQKQFQLYKKKRQQILKREEQYAKLLNQKYERQQKYMRQLKKMQQSQFHDIKVPTNMVDLSQIKDSNVFPSLVQSSNSVFNQETQSSNTQKSCPVQFGKKKKNKVNKFILKEQQFPGLQLTLKNSVDQAQLNDLGFEDKVIRTRSQKPQQMQIKSDKISESDFPQLSHSKSITLGAIQLKRKDQDQDQSQQSGAKRKGKKKNKQKFVDVTHQFFQRQQQDY